MGIKLCAHILVSKCANWSEMYAYHKIKSFYAYKTFYVQLHMLCMHNVRAAHAHMKSK